MMYTFIWKSPSPSRCALGRALFASRRAAPSGRTSSCLSKCDSSVLVHGGVVTEHFLFQSLYLLSCCMIALAAHWLIHVLSADHLSHSLWGCSDMKWRGEVASLADGLKLFDFFAFGHESDDSVEHGADTSGIQSSHNHYFSLICGKLTEYGDLSSKIITILFFLTSSKNCPSSIPITS